MPAAPANWIQTGVGLESGALVTLYMDVSNLSTNWNDIFINKDTLGRKISPDKIV